ncbi:MAG: hypothetical protein KC442_24010, partial [Thermomicrobiales bacterium]|nr:hypothetical protein [Thermomicrobiales bacterium]
MRARTLWRVLAACCVLGLAFGVAASGALADSRKDGTQNTGASNGGVATATTDGDITIGEIVTGENTGNSISTGNIAGSAELHGGEIDYPTNVNITQNIEAPIAVASGGDYGVASGPGLEPPELNVNIDNRDKNNNKSTATGIGEGGAGGTGGSGGDATVNFFGIIQQPSRTTLIP